ncbi:hypothetical protein GCM10023405_28240 [Streptomonospora salina]
MRGVQAGAGEAQRAEADALCSACEQVQTQVPAPLLANQGEALLFVVADQFREEAPPPDPGAALLRCLVDRPQRDGGAGPVPPVGVVNDGFAADRPLWERDGAKCTPCRPGSDCR